MPTIEITLPQHRYAIHVGSGILRQLGVLVRSAVPHHQAAILSDLAVHNSHARLAADALRSAGYQLVDAPVPSGEEHKSLDTVRRLYDVLLSARFERGAPIVAMGGGVTGDTVGFAAATYLRGVPLVHCPTTLLAMVDSAIGGKVGVNVPQGKNLIGAFHQPALVVIDPDTLSTLPPRELRCGLAECVKHAVIRDASLFDWIGDHLDAVLRLDPPTLVNLIGRNVHIKTQVIMADERESGERAHLNFGHTFAHAIESATGYGQFHHGEAVALGMVAATKLAVDLDRCPADLLPRLTGLLDRIGLPKMAQLPPTDALMDAMRSDKKAAAGKLRLVLPDRLGVVSIHSDIPDHAVAAAWAQIRKD